MVDNSRLFHFTYWTKKVLTQNNAFLQRKCLQFKWFCCYLLLTLPDNICKGWPPHFSRCKSEKHFKQREKWRGHPLYSRVFTHKHKTRHNFKRWDGSLAMVLLCNLSCLDMADHTNNNKFSPFTIQPFPELHSLWIKICTVVDTKQNKFYEKPFFAAECRKKLYKS